jgi:hypothetical protein
VAPSPITTFRRELIITLARQLDLPAIYPFRYFPKSGGLVSYGIDQMERRSGGRLTLTESYVEQIQVNSRYNCQGDTSCQSI